MEVSGVRWWLTWVTAEWLTNRCIAGYLVTTLTTTRDMAEGTAIDVKGGKQAELKLSG